MNAPDNISPKESKGLTQNEDRPLVSFILLAYNQERYIREAVEGALSQTYSPLEIILSDDCSTDRTFEIMQEMAAQYKGPHIVKVNRNTKNLGLLAHVNHSVKISKGDIIVTAGGDDISLNYRVEKIINSGFHKIECAYVAFSDAFVINEESDVVSECLYDRNSLYYSNENKFYILKDWKGEVEHCFSNNPLRKNSIHDFVSGFLGATAAYKRNLFTIFGDLYGAHGAEDMILWHRCKLIGKYLFIPEHLVKYRYRRNSTVPDFPKDIPEKEFHHKVLTAYIVRDINAIKDLKLLYYRKMISVNEYIKHLNCLNQLLTRNKFKLAKWQNNNIKYIYYLLMLVSKYNDLGWVLYEEAPALYKIAKKTKDEIRKFFLIKKKEISPAKMKSLEND